MAREKIRAALRRLDEPPARETIGARAAEVLRDARGAGRERLRAAWRAARRRPEAVLAALLIAGVAAMVLHWS